MALYLGSKKVAGNTTSAPLDDDVKDYKVSFDDTGVIEETFTVNDVMVNEIKTGNKLSVILGGIKKVLANILTSITNINSSLNTFKMPIIRTATSFTMEGATAGSYGYKMIKIENPPLDRTFVGAYVNTGQISALNGTQFTFVYYIKNTGELYLTYYCPNKPNTTIAIGVNAMFI